MRGETDRVDEIATRFQDATGTTARRQYQKRGVAHVRTTVYRRWIVIQMKHMKVAKVIPAMLTSHDQAVARAFSGTCGLCHMFV